MSATTALNIVEAQAQKFTEAIRQGDVEKVTALHTTHVRILPPESDLLQGQAAVRAYYRTLLDSGVKDMQIQTIDATFLNEKTIREIGLMTISLQTPAGQTQQMTAKYVVSWQEEHGEYKIDVDIWNS